MTGGAGGAAGNGGVPVLQGLGGGSATGVRFPSVTCFVVRLVELTRSEPPETCSFSGSVFLVLGPIFQDPRDPQGVGSLVVSRNAIVGKGEALRVVARAPGGPDDP